MKSSKQLPYEQLIQAFKTLYLDQYFHDSATLDITAGAEDDSLEMHLRTAMGHDGKSLELFFKDAMLFPDKDDNASNPNGSAVAVIEGRAAYLAGAAMIGFALAAEEKDELL